jgi:hypothetical protein
MTVKDFLKWLTTLAAWRCGGILCYFCRQLKPIKDKRFNDFYYCFIYKFKLEQKMNSEQAADGFNFLPP